MSLFVAITTVQPPTPAVRALAMRVASRGRCCVVVAGDKKGPPSFDVDGAIFLGLDSQLNGPFELARRLPTGHYCRKNIAYLESIRRGATCLYETDDDNAPLPSWEPRGEAVSDPRVIAQPRADARGAGRWVNVYRYFTSELIWPRGLPLDEIHTVAPDASVWGGVGECVRRAPIQQGLVNGSPDVDAVWRLTMDRAFAFENCRSVYLEPGNWCPFNTQSTWWWPVAYPLLYVPSFCSFRMCDIWKSFVAQRCLWELGLGVTFHAPEVGQARNPHNLMRDFQEEIPGFTRNRELAERLTTVQLVSGEEHVGDNLKRCYAALAAAGFFPPEEMPLVDAWLADLRRLGGKG